MSMFGDPLNISTTILNTVGTDNNRSAIFYGNYKNVAIGSKGGDTGIAVDFTTTAVISSGVEVATNLWTQDMTGWRFVMRRGIVVVNPLAFSVGINIK